MAEDKEGWTSMRDRRRCGRCSPPKGDIVDYLPAVGDKALEDLADDFLTFAPLRPGAIVALEPAAEEAHPSSRASGCSV
jgi:hypothetical protein